MRCWYYCRNTGVRFGLYVCPPQLLELVSGKDDGYVGLPHAEFTESRTALDAVGDRAINIVVINPPF